MDPLKRNAMPTENEGGVIYPLSVKGGNFAYLAVKDNQLGTSSAGGLGLRRRWQRSVNTHGRKRGEMLDLARLCKVERSNI